MEAKRESLTEANRLLTAYVDGKFADGAKVPERAKKVGMTVTNYHVAMRRLRVLGRVSGSSKPGVLPKVLNASPITEKEHQDLGDPYSRKVPRVTRTYRRKIVRSETENVGILTDPLEIAIDKEDHRDVTVTISGPPDALASFLRRVGRA